MKRLFIISLAVCLVVVSGCSSKTNLNESSASETAGYTETQQDQTTTSQSETSNAEDIPTSTERSDDTATKESVSSQTNPPDTENEVKSDKKEPQHSVSATTAEKGIASQLTASTEEKPKEKSKKEEATDSSASSEPSIHKATATDAKAVASKMVEYINAYRAEQGVSAATVLSGLTEYAECRSRQLVSNFAHDTVDERAAATALKYGKYIDPPLYGMTGEPYYTANAREAIVKAGYSGSIENVAKNIAQLTRNSSGHWEYVGGAKYGYIAIGITYASGYWYCDIAMTRENTDN